MERRFYTEEFENLIKQKADQYKMYPSDKVWKEVNRSLHPRKRWYLFGFALLLTGVGYYTVNELAVPSNVAPVSKNNSNPISTASVPQPGELIPFKIPSNSKEDKRPFQHSLNNASLNEKSDQQPDAFEMGRVISMNPINEKGRLDGSGYSIQSAINPEIADNKVPDFLESLLTGIAPLPGLIPDNKEEEKNIEGEEFESYKPGINWLHEFAAYELSVPKAKRLSWQLAFGPTMNYRKLTGSQNAYIPTDIKNIPLALSIRGDLNGLVNHKPALGFELGSSLFYALNKNLSLKMGIQFNYSRYTIQAYNSPTEIGTIALTNNSSSRIGGDSLLSYTQLRNFGGNSVRDIQNQYFQLSAPVGIEWRLIGNGRLQLNIAGTVQPTYLLNRNTYLITTDYKNYTKEPSLIRRVNINTSAEAYLSYKTGGVRWQLGPQFRYQLLSSYANEYPIKEFLMEYGVKLGVTKTIR